MIVFTSKYALTTGIEEIVVEKTGIGEMVREPGSLGRYFHTEGKDWHRTRESAVKRAEDMRARKIASVKKQLAILEKMEF